MMPSEVVLFGSVDTSVFQGFGAVKSCPRTVVVVVEPPAVVVLGREVEGEVLDDVGLEVVVAEVEVGEEVVVGFVVDVVVVVFLRAAVLTESAPPPHSHASQGWPSAQSAAVSHCSPPALSRRPSPQVDRGASKRRRPVARAPRL